MSENSEKNSSKDENFELQVEGSCSENSKTKEKSPLNRQQNVKNVIILGNPFHKDDNGGPLEDIKLEEDVSDGNHIKEIDFIEHCNSADILTVSSDRRKQATPRRRNVKPEQRETEKQIKTVKNSEKEIVQSKICITENIGKEVDQELLKSNVGKPKRNVKSTRKQRSPMKVDNSLNVSISNVGKPKRTVKSTLKQVSPIKIDDSLNVSASSRRKRQSSSEKKTPTPKRVVTPKTASAAKKCISRKKAKSPTVSKKVATPDLDCNKSSISGGDSKIDDGLNEEMSNKSQPAVSLKIICTPFSQNGLEGTPEKEDSEIPPVCTSSKKKTTLKNKRVSSPKKTNPKKTKAVVKKTGTPGKRIHPSNLTKNKRDSKTVGAKATVKKGVEKKSPVKEHLSDMDCEPSPAKEEIILKKTRGRRKMKKSEEYVLDFMCESEDDIEPDFSEDEYLPSKDQDLYVREKEKWEGKKNLRVSFSCFDEDDEDGLDENVEKQQYSFESNNKSKGKTGVKFVNSKPLTKVQTSPTVLPLKKVKIPHKKKEKEKSSEIEDGDSQNESGLDMPMLSPSKGRKTKQKKRRIRIQPEKTYLDGLDNYATGEEDMGMTTATDDEGDSLVKVRKRRRRYGEPYSVTGNWYIAQGYLFDISNLIEKFVKEEGWRFRDFAACWQQLKFSLVYRGRQNFKELLELSEEIAFLTKRFIMPPHSTKSRIGSLYALYGLYYKHPFRAFFKIRLLGEEYEQLVELIRPFQNDVENHDPAYIFRKLELDGAILHVASSLEMGIDFYNAEREAVDIKYESQRLANSLSVARTLLPDLLDGDDEILKQYDNTKVNVAGDGKEAEKSLSFVEASITGEIKEVVKHLKEETLSILRLNEPPTAKVTPSTESDDLHSSIGARRAEILAKAVKSDTSNEYLKKKCFREPLKSSQLWGKPSKQVSLRQGLSDENDSSMSNRDVQDFMKAPTKETLDTPLIPQRRSQRKVVHKYIKRHFKEENAQILPTETVDNENLSDQREEHEGESSVVDENSGNCIDPLADKLEILSRVPPVLPKPKRIRGPPRRKALSLAIEVNNPDHNLTGLKALKRKVSDEQLVEKRRKRRQLKKVEPDEESAADLSRIVVDLPLVKMEESVDVNHASPELKINENEKLDKQKNLDHTITLNIQLKGENIYKNQHFKILSNNWMAIQDNKRKLDRLKKKLISIILPDHVKQTVDEDKVDVKITVLETEDTEIVHDTENTFKLKANTYSNDLVSSTIHGKTQVNNDDHYSSADADNLTLKTEKQDYLPLKKSPPQNKSWSANDVIKDLQGMWESDSNDNAIESVDEDEPYHIHSHIAKTEEFWSAKVCNDEHKIFPDLYKDVAKDYEEDGRSEDFHDDKSFVDLVSDIDDFEDESEPIILTPGIVSRSPGYSFNYSNIGPLPSLVSSPLELKDTVMPTSLYRRADQVTESHSQGPFNATASKRYATYNSPLVVSGMQNPTLVPVSTSLPLLKSQYPQKGSLLIRQPYIQLSSDSIRPPGPYNQPFTTCGNSPSTATRAVFSSPESCFVNQIPVLSQPVTTTESQSPLLCVSAPVRFPGSVTVTHQKLTEGSEIPCVSTSVTYAHNPTSVSVIGPRPDPDPASMKLVKVINTNSVLIPESKIITSTTQMNYISRIGKDEFARFSSPSSLEEEIPSSVTRDVGNQSAERHSVLTSVWPISHIHHQTPSFGDSIAPIPLVGQDGGIKCESNSSWVSNDSKSSFSTNSSGKVCSFLFSPKFTKQSGIKSPTVQATGVPVGPKKLKVPFFFKHSLVPKKKS